MAAGVAVATSMSPRTARGSCRRLRMRTGGHAYEAKKKEDLTLIYNQIAEELRGQYLLTYTPDMLDKEGGYHKIPLKANKSDLTVATREGYYAAGWGRLRNNAGLRIGDQPVADLRMGSSRLIPVTSSVTTLKWPRSA